MWDESDSEPEGDEDMVVAETSDGVEKPAAEDGNVDSDRAAEVVKDDGERPSTSGSMAPADSSGQKPDAETGSASDGSKPPSLCRIDGEDIPLDSSAPILSPHIEPFQPETYSTTPESNQEEDEDSPENSSESEDVEVGSVSDLTALDQSGVATKTSKKRVRVSMKRYCNRVCSVTGCTNSNKPMMLWREEKCDQHSGLTKGVCPCRAYQPYIIKKLERANLLQTTMFYELALDDDLLKKTREDDSGPSSSTRICSQHFHRSMTNFVYAFPILGLNKTRRRIRLIARKYGLEDMLPDGFDTMSLDKDTSIPQFQLLHSRQHGPCVMHIPEPLRPTNIPQGDSFKHLTYSSDDEEYGINGTALPPSPYRKDRALSGSIAGVGLGSLLEINTMTSSPSLSSSKEPITLFRPLNQQPSPAFTRSLRPDSDTYRSPYALKKLQEYLEKLGCTVYNMDDCKDSSLAKRGRCCVDGCGYACGRVTPANVLFASLPQNLEVAIHCLAVASASVVTQNVLIARLIEQSTMKMGTDLKDPLTGRRVRMMDRSWVEQFPSLFCHRHFPVDVDPDDSDAPLYIRPLLIHELPIQMTYETLVVRDREVFHLFRRRWLLENCGMFDSKLIPYAAELNESHNSSPSMAEDQSPKDSYRKRRKNALSLIASKNRCAIPGCMGRIYTVAIKLRMVPVPTDPHTVKLWENSIREHLHASMKLTDRESLCELHFENMIFENVPANANFEVPTIFLSVQFNPYPVKDKEAMQKCAVRTCPNTALTRGTDGQLLRFVQFPPEDSPMRHRWSDALSHADPSSRTQNVGPLWICRKHFNGSVITADSVPNRFLTSKQSISHDRYMESLPLKDPRMLEWVVPTTQRRLCSTMTAGKRKCCVETGAIVTKLARLAEKSVTLLELLRTLHSINGIEIPTIPSFDETADNVAMYGEFGTVDSLSLARAIAGLGTGLEDDRKMLEQMNEQVNRLEGGGEPNASGEDTTNEATSSSSSATLADVLGKVQESSFKDIL